MKKTFFPETMVRAIAEYFLLFFCLVVEKNEYQVSGCLSEIIFPNNLKIKGSEKRRHLKRSTTPYRALCKIRWENNKIYISLSESELFFLCFLFFFACSIFYYLWWCVKP